MMITQNDNGSEAMAIINAALEDAGSEVTIGNENGQSIATKLNGVFGNELITSSLSGSEFTQAVEDGFDGMEPPIPPVPHETLRFLHISDCHGYTGGLAQCRDMMEADNDVRLLIVSGDFTQYSTNIYTSDTLSILEQIKSQGDKIVMVKGNHDVFDNANNNLSSFSDISNWGAYSTSSPRDVNLKKFQMAVMSHHADGELVSNVIFGSSTMVQNNSPCYWFKDVSVGDNVVRIIGIDDYEWPAKYNNYQYVSYRQAQVDWLVDLLASTPSDYHILMVTHESPFKEYGTHAAAVSMRPSNTTEANAQKLFVSELQDSFHERPSEVNVNLYPSIMKSYLHGENLDTTWTNNNANLGTLTIKKDFTGINPATLIGWVFGHNHRDCIGYMPSQEEGFDDQLLIGITACDSGVKWSGTDDLLWQFYGSEGAGRQWAKIGDNYGGQVVDEPTYRINELIIDFTTGTLTVKRHGNKTTAPLNAPNGTARPYGGRVRDEVTFQL